MSEVLPRGGLPPIQFVDVDPATEEALALQRFQQYTGQVLAEGDPRRLFLLSLVSILIQKNIETDLAAKQTLLSYATGEGLDNLGALTDTPRLPASKAVATVRFTLSAARPNAITIPAGTRVAAGQVFFETVQPITIASGTLSGDVTVEAVEAGAEGNGLTAGQIDTIVVPIPYMKKVENTTTSTGGADEESDEAYYLRLKGVTNTFSVAGPRRAYITLAMGASPAIIDVAMDSPNPGDVHVYPLLEGGELPTTPVLQLVEAALSGETVRPDTDNLVVAAPNDIGLTVDVDYWIATEDLDRAVQIQADVEEAVDDYILWQMSKIGRDIVPDQLITRMIRAGAKRVDVTSPTFTVVSPIEVAQLTSRTVNYQGAEDE